MKLFFNYSIIGKQIIQLLKTNLNNLSYKIIIFIIQKNMKTNAIKTESKIEKPKDFSKKPVNERAEVYKKQSKLIKNNKEAFKLFVKND